MKIATTFGKKLEFTPLSKKTHPKFLNVFQKTILYFKKLFPKKQNENRHHFWKKIQFYTFFQKNASKKLLNVY
jgi:hypothetical protein